MQSVEQIINDPHSKETLISLTVTIMHSLSSWTFREQRTRCSIGQVPMMTASNEFPKRVYTCNSNSLTSKNKLFSLMVLFPFPCNHKVCLKTIRFYLDTLYLGMVQEEKYIEIVSGHKG